MDAQDRAGRGQRPLERRGGRRGFARDLAGTLLAAPLLDLLITSNALAGDAHLRAVDLHRALVRASVALRRGTIDPEGWQTATAALHRASTSAELLRSLGIARLAERIDSVQPPPRSALIRAGDVEPPSERPAGVRHRLFRFAKGQAVVPHGHDGLVSLFIVLRGRFHARHYDRLADTRDHIVILPTLDVELEPGDQTSISDLRDNVHWFTARSEGALLYNLSVEVPARRAPPRRRPGRVYLDPEGTPAGDGTILAPRSDRAALRAKYDGA